ncbi:DUF7848 domain-containing protein [Kitasatospora sp. HPMI-4]|uniref:DUF7848 domain-containing protein n=1 Tax=Kitasatospora sp. HPMI-4 TaxID=3448443 RepID=UPI003F196CC6
MSGEVVLKKRRFRFIDWTIRRADQEPDTPPTTHRFVCLSEDEEGTRCGAAGPIEESFEQAQAWPFRHVRDEPSHRTFGHVPVIAWIISPKEEPE